MRPPAKGAVGGAAAAILVLAAVLRFWGLATGLPHPLTRPDEEVLLARLVAPAAGSFDLEYAVYPSLYFYVMWAWSVVALGMAGAFGLVERAPLLVVLRTHPQEVLLAARALSAVAATATVWVVMRCAARAFGAGAGLLAGLLLATDLLHVRDAHSAKPDALLTFGIAVALALMAEFVRRPSRGRIVGLGVTIGLATGIKYPALLLLAPAWVATVLASDRRGWRRLVPGASVAIGVIAGVVFVATSPYLFINPDTRRAVLGVFGSIFPTLFPTLVPPALPPSLLAMAPERHWWSGYAYHAGVSLWYGAGVPVTLLALPAVAWGWRAAAGVGAVMGTWILLYFGIHGLSPMLLSRYMTPMLPALFVLEAGLVAAVLARVRPHAQGPTAVAAVALLVAGPLAASVAHDRLSAGPDTRQLATAWLARHTRPGDRVLVAGTFFWSYGEPLMPPGVEKLRLEAGAPTIPAGVRYVLGHDHPTFASRFDPVSLGPVAARLRLVLDLDPFVGRPADAVFETFDAYYVPLAGFAAVGATGPRIRIYAVDG